MTEPHSAPLPGFALPPDRPSPWICRFAPMIASAGRVVDVACGNGRNGRHFLALQHHVVFVDVNVGAVADLAGRPRAACIAVDLESAAPWPLPARNFAAVVVVNYLHRPLFANLIAALAPGGLLLYETFSSSHETTGRPPRNPDHLLAPGELLRLTAARLTPIAFEEGLFADDPFPGVKQRLAAVNDLGPLATARRLPPG